MQWCVISRRCAAGFLGLSLVAGCETTPSSSNAPSAHLANAAARPDPGEHVYVNPHWHDDIYDDSQGVLAAVLSGAGKVIAYPFVTVGSATVSELKWLSGDRPDRAARLMEDPTSADNRRIGINKLLDFGFGTHPVFERRCREIAQSKDDSTVRATAIRGENRARDSKGTAVFIQSLKDKNDWVRLEACKALANVPDVNAVDPLIQVLGNADESRDVRIAAADALKHYRSLAVGRALSATLSEREFGVAWQARRSLRYLTNRDYGYDEAAWLAYFSGRDSPLG